MRPVMEKNEVSWQRQQLTVWDIILHQQTSWEEMITFFILDVSHSTVFTLSDGSCIG